MAYTHIARNVIATSPTTRLRGAATLAGHVLVDDFANIGAFSGCVHQFCRVGKVRLHWRLSGGLFTEVIRFCTRRPRQLRAHYGIKHIGLIRLRPFSSGANRETASGLSSPVHPNTSRALAQIERDASLQSDEVRYVVEFIRSSKRGVGLRRPSRRLEEVVED